MKETKKQLPKRSPLGPDEPVFNSGLITIAEVRLRQIDDFICALARIKGLRTTETVILALCRGNNTTSNKLSDKIVTDIMNDCLEYETVSSIPESYIPTPNPFNSIIS